VCKTCFLIYSLLSDYFDELIKATTVQKKNDYNQYSKKWVHSEKLLQQNEERPMAAGSHHKKGGSLNGPG
jgi:hypothetical protein